jgi:alanine racemase
MGRLGVWHEDAPDLCARIVAAPHLRLADIFTHFASPDDDVAFTAEQRRRFLAALQKCPGAQLDGIFIHADNSAGLETMPGASPFNAVRVGLLQFGVLPHANSLLAQVHTEPVFSFHTRVGLVKTLPRGTTISYGRTHTLARESTVAVLCAGYADGLPRAASNRAEVLIRGRRCRILGRVTMDQTVVDVSAVPGVVCGDEVVMVGRQVDDEISLAEFSRAADTIPWETLTSVTKRVPRLYKTALGV